jgi:outer membrane receptor for ferrienterochelin and colicins
MSQKSMFNVNEKFTKKLRMKFLYQLFIIALSLLFIHPFASGDEPVKKPKTDAMLFGHVKSGSEHIPFATIAIEGTTIATSADGTGHFKMTNLPVGKQTVVVSAVGYKNFKKEIVLKRGEGVTLYAELKPDVIGIEQVVVSADRNEKSRKETPSIVNTINPKLFQRTQNVTLSEGLNFSPGLRMENNCQNCGFSQIRMNGLEGPYSQILINSRPIFSGLAGVYGLELIPANMIERVEVIRGGGSSMYGSNAIAGTINLITKDPISNRFSASVQQGYNGVGENYDAAGDYSINLNGSLVSDDYKTGLSIFGFHRQRDPFDANGDDFSELSTIENVTVGGQLYQRMGQRGKLSLDYFHINESRRGGNKFNVPLHEADIAESVDHLINSAALNFDLLMREHDKLSIFASGQTVNRDSYYGAGQDLSAYGETEDFTWSAGAQYIRHINRLLFAPADIIVGLESNGSNLTDTKLGYYNPETDSHAENTLIADQKMATQAGFFQSEWKLNKLVFSAGVRFDHYSISDEIHSAEDVNGNVLSPRISLLYNLTDNIQFRTGFARGFRAPQIFDEDLHIETSGSRQVLHRNADDLRQESSNSFTASLDFSNFNGGWQYQFLAEGFYTQLIDPFANEFGDPNENGMVIYTRVNAEEGAKVMGVNLEMNASPSNYLQLQSGFTFQKSQYEEPQEFDETRFFRTPNTYGYISLNYSPAPLFDLALTGNYTGPMLVPYFGPRLENPEAGQLNKSDAFFETGLKLTYDIRITESVVVQANGGVKNLFNSYQDDFDTGIDRDPAYIYGPLSPRTIYFGVKIENF